MINENIPGKGFRSKPSLTNPSITSLTTKYECLQLSLLIITSAWKKQHNRTEAVYDYYMLMYSKCMPAWNARIPSTHMSWIPHHTDVDPYHVWTWKVSPCWIKFSRRLHSWWRPSVNSFKVQPCDHTPPRTQKLRCLIRCWKNRIDNDLQSLVGLVCG